MVIFKVHARGSRCINRLPVHVGHEGKTALRQGQRVLRKGLGGVTVDVARELVEHQDLGQTPLGVVRQANNSHRAAAASVAPKRVRMVSSKAASLAKWCLGVSSVNQKWITDSGDMC